ncbi:MAG: DNA polymerase III subunit delta [Candidatus Omnitrophota bacterium]
MARIENFFLFAGTNAWEKEEKLRQLKTSLSPGDPRLVEFVLVDGKEKTFSPESVLADLVTFPFQGRPRLTLIRDIEKTPPPFQSRLLDASARFPKNTLCVLETKDPHPRGLFFERLMNLAKCFVFLELKGPSLLSWMDRRISQYGKQITPEAKELLLEKAGEDLLRLDNALGMLSLYAGEASWVSEEAVEALLGVSLSQSSFELARAVAARETLKALMILERLLSERDRPHEIIGAVGWQLRRMLRAKELLEQGVSPKEIGSQVRMRRQEEAGFFESLSRFERSEIEAGLRELLEADHRLKTGLGEGKGEVERFVLELCR